MIFVRRPPDPGLAIYLPSAAPTKTNASQREIAAAIDFFTNKINFAKNVKLCKEKFTFRIYKDPDLGDKLETIFKGKCAYCESYYGAVTPKEIEHFRPKSEISLEDGTTFVPGYFWLGSEWTNLLTSCVDCNRARRHNVPGQTKKAKLGKGSQFPLDDETKRVRKHRADLKAEERVRLLINPCSDRPEGLLDFDDEGLVHPVFGASSFKGRKAKTSIDVYALQRKGLVEARKALLNLFMTHVATLRYLLSSHNRMVAERKRAAILAESRDEINRVSEQLHAMTSPGAPYLALLRAYIRRGEKNGIFDDLKRFGVNLMDLL